MSQALRAATSISALTLLSRVLGLVRDVVMLRLLGASWEAGTFVLAWMFPNLMRRLMGEGALASAFIPAFASTLDSDGKPAAARLLASVSGVLTLSLSALTAGVLILCFVVPPAAVGHAAEDGVTAAETGALLLRLTAILFPYVILICLVAVYGGALNSLSVFGWPAALPVLLNLFWIAGLLVGSSLFGADAVALTTITAVFLLGGGVVQLAAVAIQLKRRDCLPAPRLPAAGDPARGVFIAMAPTVVGMSMLQINALLDQGFAYYLVDPGANIHIYLANRLLLFPHALAAVALATAIFPQLAVLAARNDRQGLRAQVTTTMNLTLFLAVPASVGLILISDDLITVFFVGDEYTEEMGEIGSLTTKYLVLGLPFLGAAQLFTRAIYALGDMRLPAAIAMILVPVNLVLNSVFVLVLGLGVPGLTLSTAICAGLNVVLLRRRFANLCPGGPIRWEPLAQTCAATLVMAGVVLLSRSLFDATTTLEIAAFRLALPIALAALSYGAVQHFAGSDELRAIMARFRR